MIEDARDQRLLELYQNALSGGFSVTKDLADAPHTGFFVSFEGGQEIPEQSFTPGDIDIAAHTVGDDYLGAWFENGVIYLDRSVRFDSEPEAMLFGRANHQQAIYDANTETVLTVTPQAPSKAPQIDSNGFPAPTLSPTLSWTEKPLERLSVGRVKTAGNTSRDLEVPTGRIMYHGRKEGPEQVLQQGIAPKRTWRFDYQPEYDHHDPDAATYLATDPKEAAYWAGPGGHVYQVNTEGLPLGVDPFSYNENGEDDNYYTNEHLGPERLTYLGPRDNHLRTTAKTAIVRDMSERHPVYRVVDAEETPEIERTGKFPIHHSFGNGVYHFKTLREAQIYKRMMEQPENSGVEPMHIWEGDMPSDPDYTEDDPDWEGGHIGWDVQPRQRIAKTAAGQTFYHVAPRSARESIMANGLTPGKDPDNYPDAVYLWPQIAHAQDWQHRHPDNEIWEVQHPGQVESDPWIGDIVDYDPELDPEYADQAMMYRGTIPPSRLRLLTDERMGRVANEAAGENEAWGHQQAPERVSPVRRAWDAFSDRIPFILTKDGQLHIGNFGDLHYNLGVEGLENGGSQIRGAIYPRGQRWLYVVYTNWGSYESYSPKLTQQISQEFGHPVEPDPNGVDGAPANSEWGFSGPGAYSDVKPLDFSAPASVPKVASAIADFEGMPGWTSVPKHVYNWLDQNKPGEVHNLAGDCINPKCTQSWDEDQQRELAQYGEIKCPGCGTMQTAEGGFGPYSEDSPSPYSTGNRPGGGTKSGLSLNQMGDIGEQVVSRLHNLPCGQVIHRFEQNNWPVDLLTVDQHGNDWGVEVKTNHSQSQPRFKLGDGFERQKKILYCNQNNLRQGLIGVRLNFYTDQADIFFRPQFSDTWISQDGMQHIGTVNFADLNPFREPDGQHDVPDMQAQELPF